jgi:hypothetical protein
MTAVDAIQARRVWSWRVAGWGVAAALALLIAYATDISSIHLSSNGGAIVYAEPWRTVLRAAAFLLFGSATIGLGVYLAATRGPEASPPRRVVTLRVVSWMTAFVVSALVVWFRDPIVNFITGPPGPNIATLPNGGSSRGMAHAPAIDGLKTFALVFGFLGGCLSTLASDSHERLTKFAVSLAVGMAWAGGWLLAAVMLPVISYLAIASADILPLLMPVALLVPGFIAGVTAASVALPLQRRLEGSL